MTAGMPACHVATTGMPQAIASTIVPGMPSLSPSSVMLGCAKTSASRKCRTSSWRVTARGPRSSRAIASRTPQPWLRAAAEAAVADERHSEVAESPCHDQTQRFENEVLALRRSSRPQQRMFRRTVGRVGNALGPTEPPRVGAVVMHADLRFPDTRAPRGRAACLRSSPGTDQGGRRSGAGSDARPRAVRERAEDPPQP